MKRDHRIFIAITLPAEVKRDLARFQEQWQESIPAKWTEKDNLHITLEFLGDVDDQQLADICREVAETAKAHEPFLVSLQKIEYGPAKKIPPRYVWAVGEKSKALSVLKGDISAAVARIVHIPNENSSFSPHVTLARISEWQWKGIEPEERPEVNEILDIEFEVESVEVMESELKRGGPVYTVVESHQLGNDVF